MKALTSLITLVFLTAFLSAQGPATWSSSASYTHPALVIDGTTTYISLQDVPANTAITNTSYWATLDSLVPTETPSGADSLTAPDASEVENLSVPDSNSSTTLTGGRLINLSTRGYVGAGANRLIGGFRVYGGSLEVLVRGFGPSRANTDNLDDPILTWKSNPESLLPSTSGIVSEVDDASDSTTLSGVNASTQALLDVLVDKETADIRTVSNWDNNTSRGYTAFITNVDGTDEGVGRIGINDISDLTGDGQLVNISTRGYVGSDASQYLVAGFQIRGGNVKVCLRAFGPSRSNSDALADPQIELIQQISDFHTTKTTLAWNDDYNVDYDDGTTQTANTASDIPTYLNTLITKESAIVITLPEGDYTARVSGVGGTSGVGRVGIDKVIE
ncbi:MAG: hypothetical protein VX609_03640 [Verrucomicrobiota bacterium]|nr:hypothetical protein [Verrucomicrobiota bacterium]